MLQHTHRWTIEKRARTSYYSASVAIVKDGAMHYNYACRGKAPYISRGLPWQWWPEHITACCDLDQELKYVCGIDVVHRFRRLKLEIDFL